MTTQQKSRIEACYDAKNFLCIAFWFVALGKVVLDYIKELKHEKKKERGITITNKNK